MRFNFNTKPPKDYSKWHEWFALHPVIARSEDELKWVWLENVLRSKDRYDNWWYEVID